MLSLTLLATVADVLVALLAMSSGFAVLAAAVVGLLGHRGLVHLGQAHI